MKKTIGNKTVAGNHEQLLGKELVIDGWKVTICDTTETDSEKVYVAVRAEAVPALYLEKGWRRYEG